MGNPWFVNGLRSRRLFVGASFLGICGMIMFWDDGFLCRSGIWALVVALFVIAEPMKRL
jgi:Na+(H+)/acetate symporter ActP